MKHYKDNKHVEPDIEPKIERPNRLEIPKNHSTTCTDEIDVIEDSTVFDQQCRSRRSNRLERKAVVSGISAASVEST